MDKDKLLEKIRSNKNISTMAYYEAIGKVVRNDYDYYKDKEYAKVFLKIK